MSDSVSLTVDMREVNEGLADLAGRIDDFTPIARDFGAHMVRTWSLKFPRTSRGESAPAGGPPSVQSSLLIHSLAFEVRSDGDVVEMGSSAPHARIQDQGGTIYPREARALTVPIDPRAYGKRAKDFPDLFHVEPKAGQEAEDLGILAIAGAGEDEIIPLFALRGSVTLPARPWRIIYDDDYDYLAESMRRRIAG